MSIRRKINSRKDAKLPQAGDFATLFADRDRTPIRTFLPEHRIWQSLAVTAGAVAVLTGIAVGISQLSLSTVVNSTQWRALGLSTTPEQPTYSPQRNAGSPSVSANSGAGSSRPASSRPPRSNVVSLQPTPSSPTTPAAPPAAISTQNYTTSQTSSAQPANTPTAPSSPSLSVHETVETASNGSGAKDIVTVTSNTPLNALKVVIRVAQTGSVASTGTWTSLSGKMNTNVAAGKTAIDYLLTLNPGVTLTPGTYIFEAQYNHAAGTRNTRQDLYAISATTATSGAAETASGHF